MEKIDNSYLGIARNDMEYLSGGIEYHRRYGNNFTPQCQQICEKYLKSVVEVSCSDVRLLRTRDLENLWRALQDVGINIDGNPCELAWLKEQYFKARYSGDDYIIVTEADIDLAFGITTRLSKSVEAWWSARCEETDKHESRLAGLLKQAEGNVSKED